MSDKDKIAQLLRELEEVKAREEEAKAREEEAKVREARERQEKERLHLENRRTTLNEYLGNCHSLLYDSLRLADASISSTGFTNVLGKYYPKQLRPWTEFETVLLPQHFGFMSRICGEKRRFHQKSTTMDLGAVIARRAAGNENEIEYFEKLAVEEPVAEIVGVLATDEEARVAYDFTGFRFSGNLRELTQTSNWSGMIEGETSEGGSEQRRQAGPNKRLALEQKHKHPTIQPDGIGLRTRTDGGQTQAFVYDYKAAHKVATEHLRSAVAKEHLFREVVTRVNGVKLSRDTKVQHREEAEAFIAMALTQVFDYMITYGISYGYIAAGRSLLLLYVDRNDPQTLYCHPCLPADDVGELTGDWTDRLSRTAVAQLASFCLLSFQSEALRGPSLLTTLSMAETTLQKWPEPYEDAAYPGLKPVESSSTQSSSAPSSQASDGSEFESDAEPTGRKVGLRPRSSCKPASMLPQGDEDDEDDEEDYPEYDPSQSLPANKRKDGPSSGSEDEDIAIVDSAPTRQYCTQACLLGLKRRKDLDENCPNILLHRSDGSSRHPVNADQFTDLVKQQLLRDPYWKCQIVDFWSKRGAIGWLFKLELIPYGYTFVGKGTLGCHLGRLKHEGQVYARLDDLQGELVPVHLGLVRLDPGYILPGFKFVVHMMLMSWAGETPDASVEDVKTLRDKSLTAILRKGVDPMDHYSGNFLWNAERRCIMIIDFDRALLFPLPKHQAVSRLSGPPKRKRGRIEADARNRRALTSL
ncbi:hypothetical protein B0T26DRAFT_731697 [Lasiosphaeria miniovina]|uniref:Metalloprotease m41 ftsh n=1 Tax=Lasiosphaeria miniovina TaxID=1954250 RepID=A0AA39ZTS5_9PEZI|nr:uncharacterized protein B0T26DRAFT_731697 [Lasiosphaeria miniovina]KAK0703513.1 hypothetical protein B0T26DRAFT_731697 [Lasiosphaeria miniovina]